MAERKPERLNRLARKFNVGIQTIVEFLGKKGYTIDSNPNTKVPSELLSVLDKEYGSDISAKNESSKKPRKPKAKKESVSIDDVNDPSVPEKKEEDTVFIKDLSSSSVEEKKEEKPTIKVLGKVDLDKKGTAKPVAEEKTPQAQQSKDNDSQKEEKTPVAKSSTTDKNVKVVGKIDLDTKKPAKEEKKSVVPSQTNDVKPEKTDAETKDKEEKVESSTVDTSKGEQEIFKSEVQKLSGPRVVGKIELPTAPKKGNNQKDKDKDKRNKRRRRKRVKEGTTTSGTNTSNNNTDQKNTAGKADNKSNNNKPGSNTRPGGAHRQGDKTERTRPNQRPQDRRRNDRNRPNAAKKNDRAKPDDEDVQKQVKETLARLTNKKKSTGAKHRRQKRDEIRQRQEKEQQEAAELAKTTIQVTEFMTVAEIAQLMEVAVTDVIKSCMELGMFVSINQRLDAETLSLVAESYGYTTEFQGVEEAESIEEEEDNDEDLVSRAPIVTVMGHVDHGKTSLLDYVRSANVIAGEAGGITQHIGAYSVELKSGQKITFLDTPGHEAFTAMRARGAKVTDVAIIVVAADDSVMPQTIEAINHATAANVPIVFAINKVDKDGANPDRIKQQLAEMNYQVEEWGGKYQSMDISAKFGKKVDDLLELVLLESEILDLKANPKKNAVGSIIESTLDRGRGYVATVLVQGGTLHVGDILLAGTYTGKVKAMFNERNQRIEKAEPGEPAVILGLNGAPQAGDNFNVLNTEKEAKDIANKREQLKREMSLRTQKHVTLDEIGRRIAIGNFHELNVIIKGDVDGSIEALADSLIKLSTEEIQVNVIHKAVGQISESDVMLATASDAIIIGFQVRPSMSARKIAEKEHIDIRLYSVIYDAIEELKDAMQGMLSPELKEEIVATLEIRETFKISKVGTIAGCIVKEGKMNRNTKVRVIRDGIVVYTGDLGALKRFKDDVKEVSKGFECGVNIERFNDLKIGDIIEGYETREIQKKL
jgi:translation initiation factor IF-2